MKLEVNTYTPLSSVHNYICIHFTSELLFPQGSSVIEYHLDALWLEHIVPAETTINVSLYVPSFVCAFIYMECKDLVRVNPLIWS